MITFMYLREIQQREKNTKNIQKLEPDFYERVKELINKKKSEIQKDDLRAYAIIKEIENIKAITRYIFERRERKIIDLAIKHVDTNKGIDISLLLPHEKDFLNKIITLLREHRESVFLYNTNAPSQRKSILNEEEKKEESEEDVKIKEEDENKSDSEEKKREENKYIKLKALKDIKEFLAEDKQFYGPYFKGQEFMCPLKSAEVLLKGGYADKVE